MKKIFIIALLFVAFRASSQNIIPGQEASKYVGQKVSAYGYVYKIEREPKSKTWVITFGSKYLSKGVVLKLSDESKLQPSSTFQDVNGHFISVTGKVIKEKGKVFINGDDPSTLVSVKQQSLAVN